MCELSPLKHGGFVLLTIQQVITVLLLWWGKKFIPKDSQYIPSCMVVVSEFGKLIFSMLLFYADISDHKSITSFLSYTIHYFIPVTRRVIISIIIPAFFYSIQNNLLVEASRELDPITFQVGYQLKLVVYVLLSRMLFGIKISNIQFLAILMLILGVVIVSSNINENSAKNSLNENYSYGLVYLCLASFISGLTSIITENFLRVGNLWLYFIQISAYTLIFSFPIACLQDSYRIQKLGFFYGFDYLFTWIVLIVYICGGFLVAVVVKYMGSIWKGFSSALALIIQAIIQYYIKGGALNINHEITNLLFGLFSVVSAIIIYSIFGKQKLS